MSAVPPLMEVERTSVGQMLDEYTPYSAVP